jgi:hypothetical protein
MINDKRYTIKKIIKNRRVIQGADPPPFLSAHPRHIAKLFQIYAKQCSCADVNSLYKRKAELTQWSL